MKQRFLLKIILPIFASMPIIGSGYAIWNFNNTVSVKSENISLSITNLIRGAYLTTNFDTFKITFDQTSDERDTVTENNESGSNVNDSAKGIYLSFSKTETSTNSDGTTSYNTSDVTDPKVNYVNDSNDDDNVYTNPENSKDENGDPLVGQVFNVVLTLSTDLAAYLNVETSKVNGSNINNWSDVVINNNEEGLTTYTWTNKTYGEVDWKWSYASFSYKSLMEPRDLDAYNALKEIVDKSTNSTCLYEAYRWVK